MDWWRIGTGERRNCLRQLRQRGLDNISSILMVKDKLLYVLGSYILYMKRK